MPNTETRTDIRERINKLSASIDKERTKLNELRKQDYDAMIEETAPLIGKCFKATIEYSDCRAYHYVMITGYPKLTVCRGGVEFNQYRFPSIQFYISDRGYPFSFEDDKLTQDVFFFDMVFTGSLPEEYRYGATASIAEGFVEVPANEFNLKLNLRFAEFKAKILETQGNA